MAKVLQINMGDGSRWEVPAQFIAEDRARYYVKRDVDNGDGDFETNFEGEFTATMSRNYELTDWAAYNMNWSDLAPIAVRVEVPATQADMEALFASADISIVVKDASEDS